MMHRFFLALLLLSSCTNARVTSNNNAAAAPPLQPTVPGTDLQAYWKNMNCPRGVPEPTLSAQNPNIVGQNFTLTKDGGLETAKLFSGDSLYVEDTGCNYYSLKYMLKSYAAEAASGNAAYWYQRASDLLLALQDSKVPFDYQDLSAKLAEKAKSNATTNSEIALETGNKGKSTAALTSFGKIPGGGYMTLHLVIGPM
jgi:hypothetical protein